jgi:hypothetical protein
MGAKQKSQKDRPKTVKRRGFAVRSSEVGVQVFFVFENE